MIQPGTKELTTEDVLATFVEHLHLSAEALKAIIKGVKPEDNRESEDTVMEFGFLPASNSAGDGDDSGAMYLEDSQMYLESSTTPILEEGST